MILHRIDTRAYCFIRTLRYGNYGLLRWIDSLLVKTLQPVGLITFNLQGIIYMYNEVKEYLRY